MHIHSREGKGKVGVSHKEMGGDAKSAPNYVRRYVQKPPVKAHLYFAVKILRLLKAGVNQDAHMPPGEMVAVTRAR